METITSTPTTCDDLRVLYRPNEDDAIATYLRRIDALRATTQERN